MNILEMAVKTGVDILLPLKSKSVFVNELPWINDNLKSLIRERQSALAQGNMVNFRHLRNHVNCMRKTCHAKYYASKVEHLRNCNSCRWWKEVKSFGGMQLMSCKDPISFLKHIVMDSNASPEALANTINNIYFSTYGPIYTLGPY